MEQIKYALILIGFGLSIGGLGIKLVAYADDKFQTKEEAKSTKLHILEMRKDVRWIRNNMVRR